MTVKRLIVCDGCDENKVWGGPENAVLPQGYVACKITLGSFGTDVHLCERCYKRGLEYADPRKWPRAPRPSVERPA